MLALKRRAFFRLAKPTICFTCTRIILTVTFTQVGMHSQMPVFIRFLCRIRELQCNGYYLGLSVKLYEAQASTS